MTRKRVILAAGVIILLFTVLFGIWHRTGMLASIQYRVMGTPGAFYRAVYTRLEPGDSMERFQDVLGSASEMSDQRRNTILAAFEKFAARYPDDFPDGVEKDDAFLEYLVGKGTRHQFQFRDGRAVNLRVDDFVNYRSMDIVGGKGIE